MPEVTTQLLEAEPRAEDVLRADERPREVGRIEAFSDGVFAIAITLLSLELVIPLHEDLGAALSDLWPNFFALALSFAVIGSYWVFHHRLFTAVVRYDRRLIWLNLLVLFFIVLMPFTTSVIADYGGEPLGVVVYAADLVGAGLASAALTAYVFAGRRMCALTVSDGRIRYAIVRSLVVPAYFAASLLLLLLPGSTSKVTWSWIGIPLVVALVDRRFRREDR
jgi:uncharacterized membrane protein